MHIDNFAYSKCSLQETGNGIYLSPWNADKYFSAPTSLPVQTLPFLRMQIKNDPRFIYLVFLEKTSWRAEGNTILQFWQQS